MREKRAFSGWKNWDEDITSIFPSNRNIEVLSAWRLFLGGVQGFVLCFSSLPGSVGKHKEKGCFKIIPENWKSQFEIFN